MFSQIVLGESCKSKKLLLNQNRERLFNHIGWFCCKPFAFKAQQNRRMVEALQNSVKIPLCQNGKVSFVAESPIYVFADPIDCSSNHPSLGAVDASDKLVNSIGAECYRRNRQESGC